MTTERDLGGQLEAIPGVASADVSHSDDGPPVAKVYLDGTEPADAVRAMVGEVLGAGASVVSEGFERQRRSGLGKGLAEVMSLHDGGAAPTHFSGQPEPDGRIDLLGVAIVESVDQTTVEVKDSAGGCVSEVVTGSIDDAVIAAIRELASAPEGIDIDIVDIDTDAGAAVVATARDDDGRAVGSSFVEFGRPWAVALAVAATLDEL